MIFAPFSFLNSSAEILYNFTSQSLAWQSAIVANGGSMPNATLQVFDDYFFKPMISASLLTEFDRINIYVGTGNQIAARTSLVSSSTYLATPVSSPTWANNLGYRSAGAGSYLNLNYTPTLQAVKYLQRGATAFYMVKNPTFTTQVNAMGGHTSTGNILQRTVTNGGQFQTAYHNTVSTNPIINGSQPTMSGNIMHVAAMTGSGTSNAQRLSVYQDTTLFGSTIGNNVTAPFMPAASQYELTYNSNGTPNGSYETVAYHMTSAHGSFRLFQSGSNIASILQTLYTQLGV